MFSAISLAPADDGLLPTRLKEKVLASVAT
jgi:hypothetical protein